MDIRGRSVVSLEWLYAIVASWIVYKLLDQILSSVIRLIKGRIIRAWQWVLPRFLSFVYLRVMVRLSILAIFVETKSRRRFGGSYLLNLFFLSAIKGFNYQSEYSDDAKSILAEMRAILAS